MRVMIADSQLPITDNWLGEGGRIQHQGPFVIDEVRSGVCTKLSGIVCSLGPKRFRLLDEIINEYLIY